MEGYIWIRYWLGAIELISAYLTINPQLNIINCVGLAAKRPLIWKLFAVFTLVFGRCNMNTLIKRHLSLQIIMYICSWAKVKNIFWSTSPAIYLTSLTRAFIVYQIKKQCLSWHSFDLCTVKSIVTLNYV